MDFTKIKLLVLDFDGVLTDNRVLVSEDGKESVFCNRSDGLGIEMMKKKGIEVMVISKEKNKVVMARCKKLGIACQHGVENKIDIFTKVIKKKNLKKGQVCYIGNDTNDLDCIRAAGIGIAVKDSYRQVLDSASYVTKKNGGKGAVREIADLILGLE